MLTLTSFMGKWWSTGMSRPVSGSTTAAGPSGAPAHIWGRRGSGGCRW